MTWLGWLSAQDRTHPRKALDVTPCTGGVQVLPDHHALARKQARGIGLVKKQSPHHRRANGLRVVARQAFAFKDEPVTRRVTNGLGLHGGRQAENRLQEWSCQWFACGSHRSIQIVSFIAGAG